MVKNCPKFRGNGSKNHKKYLKFVKMSRKLIKILQKWAENLKFVEKMLRKWYEIS